MKVKVNVKTSPKAQEKYYEQAIAEAYAEMEAMFQENKNLRVSEGHLRDDLACAEARIEKLTAELAQVKKDASHAAFATGEILLEAERKAHEQEALIAELNDQIAASETDAAFWKKAAAENAELAEQNIAQVAAWERSVNELKHEVAYRKSEAEEAIAELAKYDIGHYQREIDEWQTTADQLAEKCQKFQDERDKAWAALRELQNVESELEYYQDIAAHRKERINQLMERIHELETELAELNEDYDALVQTKREYGECIDTLRQENKRLRNQIPLPEFMRQFIEMTREAVQNEFPDSGNS
jgi:chromosome segregation ATPase